jgi:hypothetical protein
MIAGMKKGKEIPPFSQPQRLFFAGGFFDGQISVHDPAPIGLDGRRTAWRDALAARLGVCLAAEGGSSGGFVEVRLRGLWLCGLLFLWRKVGEAPPHSSAFRAAGRRTFVRPGIQRWTIL